jgi:hypothetical protein
MQPVTLSKRIAILQSDYIPWKGYFDIINSVDEFIIYDDAQYTKRNWRNRNLIKTKAGLKWLTIPVEVKHKYKQTIREVKVVDSIWPDKHLKAIKHNYSKAKHFKEINDWLIEIYKTCEKETYLSDINLIFIREIASYLGIETKISFSCDYKLEGNRSDKAMKVCLDTGSDEYLSGPAAKVYLDTNKFEMNGIKVKWMDYTGYSEYNQLFPPFCHEVSIIDLLMNVGKEATKYMKSFEKCCSL